jgi:Heterokaryon incompatibility protein (HET)
MHSYIDPSLLPKTFQDALEVTRYFGVRYLWIDSLCILQDSQDDWRRESALTGQIYQDSYCNIAAMTAQDPTEGLFFHRKTALMKSIFLLSNPLLILKTPRKLPCGAGVGSCRNNCWRHELYSSPSIKSSGNAVSRKRAKPTMAGCLCSIEETKFKSYMESMSDCDVYGLLLGCVEGGSYMRYGRFRAFGAKMWERFECQSRSAIMIA